LLNTIKIILRS